MPLSAHSAGLGKLTVISGLGEPLKAEIDLVSTTPEELSSLSAAIAPHEAYAVQGLERGSIHNAIQVDVVKKPDGSAFLKLSTRQPVDDPFLDMLIQVDWATGRLLREYTVLLDPPGYQQESVPAPISAAKPIQTAEPVIAKPLSVADSVLPQSSASAEQEYQTRSGDTLNKIAKEMQVDGYSLDQMLVAIYRNNPQAFDGNNMNRLKVGQIIKAPSNDDMAALTQQEASKEIRVQTADWNAYRNKLAGIVADAAPAAEDAGTQAASGKLKTATEDKAAAQDSGPKDVVKLSKSEAAQAGDSANAKALQDKLTALQEENTARQKSVDEANERVAMLEKQIADLQALLTIKDKTLAGLQQNATDLAEKPAETIPEAMPEPMVEEGTTPEPVVEQPDATTASNVETEKPADTKPAAKKPKPAAKPMATPEPSLLDGLQENLPLMGAAGAAIVLLGGGWFFLRNRRKRNLDSFEQGILTAGGLKANTVFGNTSGGTVDTGDTSFLTDFSQSPSGMIDTHDVDPIAEAEVYMAYGRDSQAEEILNDAISKEPTRYELHLKLLEIFAGRSDTSAFEAVAGELYSTLGSDDPVWMKVAEMGHKMEPSNPLYDTSKAHVPASSIPAAATAAVAGATAILNEPVQLDKLDASDFDNAEVMTESSLDFSLDAEPATVEAKPDTALDNNLDFDLGFSSADSEASAATEENASADAMDSTVQLDASPVQSNEMDFNMDFGQAETLGESEPKSAPAETDDLGDAVIADIPEIESTIQFEAPEFNETLPNIDMPALGMDSAEVATPEDPDFSVDIGVSEPALVAEPATDESAGLDFNFDLGSVAAEATEDPVEVKVEESSLSGGLEMDLSGISLDMDASESNPVEEINITHDESEDVNTKLDLVTAYMDMGDTEGARELLDEVLKEGGPNQKQRAQALLDSLA